MERSGPTVLSKIQRLKSQTPWLAQAKTILLSANNGSAGYDLDVSVQGLFSDGMALHDLWEGSRAQVAAGCITGMTLPPRSAVVLMVVPS